MPGNISCEDCRATVKKFNPNKEPNCKKCKKVQVLPGNNVVYNIIRNYAPIIFDGDRISARGIEKALDWSYICAEDIPNLATKIVCYFSEVIRDHHRQLKKGK